jgi:dTDP-4-amino-4,6-dideoxygalactose transaminase
MRALENVMNSKMIATGALTNEFECQVASYLGLKGGVATASGTAALYMSLKALGVGVGDEVILPTYVCTTVLYSVQAIGATPVLCDVGEDWVISHSTIRPCITGKTKAIIAPHICGIAIDIDPIVAFGVPVIEDLAQSFGAVFNSVKVGGKGRMTVCSFKGIKCLTTGEGGMILSNDEELLEKARSMKILSPMNDIQAALGISQLKQYGEFLQRRNAIADYYFERLSDISSMCMPIPLRKRSMFFRFPLRVQRPFTELLKIYETKGIAIRQFIDCLLHRILKHPVSRYPMAELNYKQTISLPIYPSLTNYEVEYIADSTMNIIGRYHEQ